MPSDSFQNRRRALEDSFFAHRDEELLEQLRQRQKTEGRRKAIAEASGITNGAVLDALVELNFDAETLAALTLVPMVRVAWADGFVAENERVAISQAAHQKGIDPDTPSGKMLSFWLKERPNDKLMDAWKAYVAVLADQTSPEVYQEIRQDVLVRARHVAESSGGMAGIGAVSSSEKAVLADIEAAFKKGR